MPTRAERRARSSRARGQPALLATPLHGILTVRPLSPDGVPPKADHSPRLGTPHPIPLGASNGISYARHKLRVMAQLSGSLTDLLAPHAAALLVDREALPELGAKSAAVLTVGTFPPPRIVRDVVGHGVTETVAAPPDGAESRGAPGPKSLTLVHAIGVPKQVAAALDATDLTVPSPIGDAVRTGAATFLGSERELRARADGWCDAILAVGARAAAAVPVWANGELRGVLALTWHVPRKFTADERAFVATLGVMCAQAIMRGYTTMREQRARDDAERSNVAKGRFLRTMSHEFRTPISAILNYTEVLAAGASGPVTAVQKTQLDRMRRSSEHLLSLIEELLRFARVEAGEEVVRSDRVFAAQVVADTLDIVGPIAEHKGVRIRSMLPDQPLEVETDPLKLRQILVNLVTNAVKYTDAGEVLVIVTTVAHDGQSRITFTITDTGRGIALGDQPRVFDLFWQANQSRMPSEGSGLGLSVARDLARLLGGDVVMVRSEPGRGSTFVAWLPTRTLARRGPPAAE